MKKIKCEKYYFNEMNMLVDSTSTREDKIGCYYVLIGLVEISAAKFLISSLVQV